MTVLIILFKMLNHQTFILREINSFLKHAAHIYLIKSQSLWFNYSRLYGDFDLILIYHAALVFTVIESLEI